MCIRDSLRPSHRPPAFRAVLTPDRSRATKTGQITSRLQTRPIVIARSAATTQSPQRLRRRIAMPLRSKVVITCAVTGSIHTPTMSPYLPLTPDEVARDAIAAAEAGAAILHLHARDPKDGRPTPDPEVFMEFLPAIKDGCDAVINITTGGGHNM